MGKIKKSIFYKKKDKSSHSFNWGLEKTLLVWFLVIALVPLFIVAATGYLTSKKILIRDAYNSLATIASLRTANMETFFSRWLLDLDVQSKNINNIHFLEKLKKNINKAICLYVSLCKVIHGLKLQTNMEMNLEGFRRFTDITIYF